MTYLYCYWRHHATDREHYDTLAEAVERWLGDWRLDAAWSPGVLDVEHHVLYVPDFRYASSSPDFREVTLPDEDEKDICDYFDVDVRGWRIEEFHVPEEC